MGIESLVLVQVKPVVVFVEMELSVCHNGFFGGKIDQQAIGTTSPATIDHRLGIETQLQTCLSLAINVVDIHIHVLTADVAIKISVEHVLRIARAIDDTSLESQM